MFYKKIFFLSSAIAVLFCPALALAQYGLEETAGAAGLAKYGTSIPGMIGNILGTALSLVGVLFFALMLFGGVMWMMSRGNAEQEKKALDTITAAIIGIIIVLGSYALTSFVFNNLVKGGGNTTPSQGNGDNPPPVKICVSAEPDDFNPDIFCEKLANTEETCLSDTMCGAFMIDDEVKGTGFCSAAYLTVDEHCKSLKNCDSAHCKLE